MSEIPQHIIVLCTCPDEQTATIIADRLVGEACAACVNIVQGIQSVYQWQGKIKHDKELLLIIKTRQDNYPALESLIRQLHPYELPEIVAVSIECGLNEYLKWIDQSVGK